MLNKYSKNLEYSSINYKMETREKTLTNMKAIQ